MALIDLFENCYIRLEYVKPYNYVKIICSKWENIKSYNCVIDK